MKSNPEPKSDETTTTPVAEWTVMVYMAGDNNLSAECVWALTEMKRGMELGMPSEQIKVIAQFDPNDGLARTSRYEITSEGVQRRSELGGKHQTKELDQMKIDVAGWDPTIREALFDNESINAGNLADLRRKEADLHRAQKLAEPQALDAHLRPEDLGASVNDTDSASPVTLYNFLSWGIESYPARHYMIVLSGHSAGVEPSYLLRDDSSDSYMTFRQLRAVFHQLKNDLSTGLKDRASEIDILGFDTCLMSMAEVCCELEGCVSVVIGSETYTPSSGWPYLSILEDLCKLTSKPELPGRIEVAKMVVDKYMAFYKPYVTSGVSVALSALDVTKVEGLAPVVEKLSKVLTKRLTAEHPELLADEREERRHPFTDALVLAHWEAQSYNGEWYVDLIDFCDCLKSRYPKENVRDACNKVIDFLKNTFIIKTDYCGPTYQYSYGVAIYFPWSSVATYFWDFDFAITSGWGDFLACYTNATRRKFRKPDKDLTDDEQKRITEFGRHGGNFLNYDRNENQLASEKPTSVKRASDKGLDISSFNRMSSHRRASDKRASDKRASDKRASDKMGSDKSGNPIHSMRNPPIVSHDFDF